MRYRWAIVAWAVLSCTPVLAQEAPWQPSTPTSASAIAMKGKSDHGITFTIGEQQVRLEIWAERILRVSVNHGGGPLPGQGLAVVGTPHRTQWTLSEADDRYLLTTPAMRVAVDRRTGQVSLLGADGNPVIGETDAADRRLGNRADPDGPVQQRFNVNAGQAIYGLGQHQVGAMDQRGHTVRLQQANTDVGVPVLVSSNGYGLFWNNAAVTDVAVDTPQAVNQIIFRSQAGSGIDYFLFAGPSVDDVIAAYRQLTGPAPLMARWTWGLWQSKERYKSQAELLAVAAEYRRLGIPLDAIVQDWQYWKPGEWGSHRFDPARFPDPRGMLETLHRQNIHSIVSIWPRFDLNLDTTQALEKVGGLYPKTYQNVYPEGKGRWYDAFSAPARAQYWHDIAKHLGPIGFDGYWLDGSEAELGGRWGEMREVATAAGPGAEVYNAYPLMHTTAVHDGMVKDAPGKRPIILTRSAWAGQQRNAAITWSGDVVGRWDVLREQVPAAVNFSMSGIPYWSADIGGFFGGSPSNPGYQELFTRWLQFAVFNPMFRIHGTGEGKEIYSFPEASRPPMLDAITLRYRLLPFFYALSWQVTNEGASFLYPVGMVFPQDRKVHDLPGQFMFGPTLMISPVLEPGTATRSVVLPAGSDWYDFWTGERHQGGRTLSVPTPIQTIPVHVKAGTILPMGAPVQYADQSPAKPIELRVYRGADGQFTLYDDAGDGHGWRNGEHTTISLFLNDKAATLTLSERQGRYPGMPQTRQFRIVQVSTRTGTGLGQSDGIDVLYDGRQIVVPLTR